jgi:[ribosomal protein S18]-alanine N-acetyltransferase
MSAQPQALLRFEPMRMTDLNAIMAIENLAYVYPWTLGNFRDSLQAGHHCVLCCYGEELVGYAVVMVAAGEAHLLNLTVAPAWHGQGFGGQLLARLLRTAREGGAEVFLLEVRPSNEAAQNLYVRFGFRAIGLRRGYYPAVMGREDAIVMERKLA